LSLTKDQYAPSQKRGNRNGFLASFDSAGKS
jgi:hypothetical protein